MNEDMRRGKELDLDAVSLLEPAAGCRSPAPTIIHVATILQIPREGTILRETRIWRSELVLSWRLWKKERKPPAGI